MLRVTSNMMSSQLLINLNRNAGRMNDTQLQLSTGRKINKPSDDPVGTTYALRYRSEISANVQYQKNVDSAISWLDFNETVLSQTGDVVQRLRQLTVQSANGTNPQSALDSIKQEMTQLKEQLIDVANSQLNGKYIFNGQDYNNKPYTFPTGTDGSSDTTDWSGISLDSGAINYVVGESVQLPINMSGDKVFGKSGDSDNLFAIIDRISQALDSSDFSALSAELGSIDSRFDRINTARAEIGAKTNRIELMQSRLTDLEVNLTDLQAKVEDADYAKLVMQSKIQENIYNASLSAGASIIQPSLVDFIR